MKSMDKKKTAILCSMLLMILCVTAVNHRLAGQEDLSVSAGYEDYERDQMEHDGEVLVFNPMEEASIVTSDNVEELTNQDTYFDEMRSSITMDRNEILSMLTDIIDDLPEGAEKTSATQSKLKLID